MSRWIAVIVRGFCGKPLSDTQRWTCTEGVVRREQEGKGRSIAPSWCQLQVKDMRTHCWRHLQDMKDPNLPRIFLQDPLQANAVWLGILQSITEPVPGTRSATSQVIDALTQLQSVSGHCLTQCCCVPLAVHRPICPPLNVCVHLPSQWCVGVCYSLLVGYCFRR